MMTHLQNYNKAKNVFAEYRASGYSRKYYVEHRDVLALRQAAKQAFDEYVKEHGKDTPLPRLKDLHAEYATVLERKKKTYAEYRKQKLEMQDYLMAQKIVERQCLRKMFVSKNNSTCSRSRIESKDENTVWRFGQ